MGTFYRYSNLVTKGNLGLVAAGQKVISDLDDQTYLPFPVGQPIAYDPFTGLTLDAAGIATAKGVRIGVGHNPNHGGRATLANQIRHIGAGDIDLCKTEIAIAVTQPGCPTPQVIDFEFGCTLTGQDYFVALDIDDWMTRAYFKEGASGPLTFNLRTDTVGCTNCTEEENCDKLACQLAAKINGKYIQHFPGTSKLGLNTGMPGYGIWAVQKFTNTRTFTIAASAVVDSCGDGCAVKGLKSIGAANETTLAFANVVDPSAPTQTLVEQIPTVISQINTFLMGKGSAYLKKVDCCSYEIEVNSCLTGVTLTYHDNSTATYADTSPFTQYTLDEMCDGCAAPATDTYSCGVRIYVDPLELPCNCYPASNPPNYLGRTVKVTAWGDGWYNTSYRVVEVAKMSIAVGTGYEVQQNELKQSNGGEGFDYTYGQSYTDGRFELPLDSSAINQASVADCNDLYCIWSVVVENHFAPSQRAINVQNAQSVSFVNVPRGDTTTITAMEELFTALAARGFCSSAEVACIPASS